MAYICINYAGVLEANQILKKAVRELRELEDMCLFLSKTVAPEIQAHSQIEERLRNCCRSAQVLCQTADMVLETAEFGLAEYRNTEEKLMRLVLADDEILLLFQLGACGQSTLTWEEQYDLGVRYLSDGNYEEAIIAFTAAIDIDPKRVESYVSMAEAYQQQEEYDLAREILMRGYEETKSERLQNILDAIEANTVLSSNR